MVLAAFAIPPAFAQWPQRTVRIVVPYGAGGGIDLLTRAVAPRLAEAWGQSVIVENRPGAGTSLGSDAVAKAAPDGHTLLMNASSIAIAFGTYARLPFKPGDLAPITIVARMPMVLVAGAQVPASTMGELIELSRTRPGGVDIATSGQGGIGHLVLELIKHRGGLRATHLPYKSNSESIPDVVGGRVDGIVTTVAGVMPAIRKGQLKPIALTAATRWPALPEARTMAESGVADAEVMSWFGLFAPAGTPAAVLDRIHRDVGVALKHPAVQQTLESQGLEGVNPGPAEFARVFDAEIRTWLSLIREAGLKFD